MQASKISKKEKKKRNWPIQFNDVEAEAWKE